MCCDAYRHARTVYCSTNAKCVRQLCGHRCVMPVFHVAIMPAL